MLINLVERAEPFDHADWVFEAKFDGFRAATDTDRGRLISRNGNRIAATSDAPCACGCATASWWFKRKA
jgi:ATP-dependent DNA ligase